MNKTYDTTVKRLGQLLGVPMALGLAVILTGCAGDSTHRSTGESVDDGAVTARVKSALRADTIYKYSDVKVTTFKGRVQLSGFANSKEEKAKAAELARTARGVEDVENNITVK